MFTPALSLITEITAACVYANEQTVFAIRCVSPLKLY